MQAIPKLQMNSKELLGIKNNSKEIKISHGIQGNSEEYTMIRKNSKGFKGIQKELYV